MPHKNQYMYTAGITFSMRTTMSLILLQGKEQQLKRLLNKNCAMYLLSICYREYSVDERLPYLHESVLLVSLNNISLNRVLYYDHVVTYV